MPEIYTGLSDSTSPCNAWAANDGTSQRPIGSLGSKLLLCDPVALPHAADLARLGEIAYARGEAVAPDRVEPAYLRDKVALTLAEQGKK